MQDCIYLAQNKREIISREDCIKIRSLIHKQISAPVIMLILKYSWFTAGFSMEREIFSKVNQVCFPIEV